MSAEIIPFGPHTEKVTPPKRGTETNEEKISRLIHEIADELGIDIYAPFRKPGKKP